MPAAVERRLQPELLDVLPADDPRVRRCRRDLRLINWLMGNHRWIRRQLNREPDLLAGGVVELGAGDGAFLRRLRRQFPTLSLAGYDLAPRPVDLPTDVAWYAGDLLKQAGPWPGTVLVANLFLHHFATEHIKELGRRLDGVRLLLIGEGHRSADVLRRSAWLNPLVGEVTRHDMAISLQAGFVPGELPDWLGLDRREWEVRELDTLFGAHRLVARRRA